MKSQAISFVLFFSAFVVTAQTKLYVHPNAAQYASSTNMIGILPLRTQVNLRP